jgi:hypothetical protein
LIKASCRYRRCFQASELESGDEPDIDDDFKCTSPESPSEDSMYEDDEGSPDVETRVATATTARTIRGSIVDL